MFLDILDQALRQEERIFAGAFGRLGQVIERPTMVSIVSLVKESLVGIETRLRKLDEKADAAPFDLQRCIVPGTSTKTGWRSLYAMGMKLGNRGIESELGRFIWCLVGGARVALGRLVRVRFCVKFCWSSWIEKAAWGGWAFRQRARLGNCVLDRLPVLTLSGCETGGGF